ncbi:LysE family translocator [Aureimonas mangrovi]|uniref:LysE family translocator n=1 Tax=Aureimonas mangrovi TaxID=2758041 RepID=UPI00163D9AC7|nr:LysE family translocator [Aureimonas mangrovi]
MTFLPDAPSLLAFTLAALVLTMTPGPDMTLFLGRTLSAGRAAGIATMLGASTGILVHTTLAALGLSALIAASPQAFLVLKVVGAGYLVFLAVQALRSGSALRLDTQAVRAPRSLTSHWLTGVGVNLLNPKVILFNVTFMPQFVSAADPHAWQKLFFFGVYFIVIATPIALAIILAAERFTALLRRKPKIMRAIDWIFASVFSGFALHILLARA